MTPLTPDLADEAHHADNQRRFMALEDKIDKNTAVTEKLAADTSDLLDMWRDAGVFFKWMRRLGAGVVWIRNVALACMALYVLWRYGADGKP